MTISRLLILQALLACGLGGVFLIPHVAEDQPCRVKMELPKMLGDWVGTPAAVSEKEHAQLAKDTEFERKMYNDGLGDEIYVSIVLSGHELDSSIHRPERCLSAQGWTTEDASGLKVPVAEAPGGWLPVTRLRNWKEFTDSITWITTGSSATRISRPRTGSGSTSTCGTACCTGTISGGHL